MTILEIYKETLQRANDLKFAAENPSFSNCSTGKEFLASAEELLYVCAQLEKLPEVNPA